jgi:hypothetical protein
MNKYFTFYEGFNRLDKSEQRYYLWDMIKWCVKQYIKTYKK